MRITTVSSTRVVLKDGIEFTVELDQPNILTCLAIYAQACYRHNLKVHAIKHVRAALEIGLREAKSFCDDAAGALDDRY